MRLYRPAQFDNLRQAGYTAAHFRTVNSHPFHVTTVSLSFLLVIVIAKLLVLIKGQEPRPVGRQAQSI